MAHLEHPPQGAQGREPSLEPKPTACPRPFIPADACRAVPMAPIQNQPQHTGVSGTRAKSRPELGTSTCWGQAGMGSLLQDAAKPSNTKGS